MFENFPEYSTGSWINQDTEGRITIPVCTIMEPYTATSPETTVETVRAMFKKDEPISAVIVMQDRRVLGLVMSLHLERVLSRPYGVALYYNKPIKTIMNAEPLMVDMATPLEEVARMAMGRENTMIFDHIIVCEQDEIKGIVTVQDILDTLAGQQKKRADFFARTNRKLNVEIIERKRAESERLKALDALKSSDEKYRSIFDNTDTGMILFDSSFSITMINGKMYELIGKPEGSPIQAQKIFHFVPSVYMKKIYTAFSQTMNSNAPALPLSFEMEIFDSKGNIKNILVRVSFISGTMEGIATVTDLTDQKRDEREKNRLATALEQSSEGIFITSHEGLIDYVNSAFEKITDYSGLDVIGKRPDFLWSRDQDRAATGGGHFSDDHDHAWRGRVVLSQRNGGIVITETVVTPIFDQNGVANSHLFILRDVSVEDQLQKKLQQSQKMQAIGTLAGGIAHDFNNILAGIMGFTEITLFEAEKGGDLERRMNRVLSACQRAKELVDQILTFSRQAPQEQTPIQVGLIVKEALKLIRATIPANIQIKQNILAKNDVVIADPSQIHQIIMNLCSNASHAMRNTGGILSVNLEKIELDRESARNFIGISPGSYIRMVVSDTGCGIPRHVIERIFEPFFTTKKQNEGTGMGLAVVHGIVKQLGGAIHVYSEPEKGTEFKILIPRHEKKIKKNPESSVDVYRGAERVLLVDDEELIIDVGKAMLESLGYKVTSKISSLEALELFKEDPYAFDLLITDQTMPRITGDELALQFLACRPDIPVVLCTGFSSTMTESKAMEMGIKAFVMKPFIKKDIARVVRTVLDGGQYFESRENPYD